MQAVVAFAPFEEMVNAGVAVGGRRPDGLNVTEPGPVMLTPASGPLSSSTAEPPAGSLMVQPLCQPPDLALATIGMLRIIASLRVFNNAAYISDVTLFTLIRPATLVNDGIAMDMKITTIDTTTITSTKVNPRLQACADAT